MQCQKTEVSKLFHFTNSCFALFWHVQLPTHLDCKNLYILQSEFDNFLNIIRCPLLKYRMISLIVLGVFEEPLGEPNTERREKNQPVFQDNY